MKRAVASILALSMAAALMMGACAKPATPSAPAPAAPAPKTLDIGIVTPLTGPIANLGTNVQNAALMVIEDQNKQGGVTIAGQTYVLNPIIRDSKADVVLAKSLCEELVFDKKVKVIIGPCIADAVGAQTITEPNRILSFMLVPIVKNMSGPNKPYTFFFGAPTPAQYNTGAAYVHKFYPDYKTVVTIIPDLAHTPTTLDAVQTISKLYGFDWLGAEKFPITTKDFIPFITRALAKDPDIIDTSTTGGDMGAQAALLIKQLREAGFQGIIWMTTPPPPGAVEEIVAPKYLDRVITNDINWESPIVSEAYRDVSRRYVQKYNTSPIDIVVQVYNVTKPFFEFLNGQDTMDTTTWMEGFAKHHWQGYFGHEAWWIGKALWGIDRMALKCNWASEYINGKLETRWEPPLPLKLVSGTPTGEEILLKAFDESAGKTVDVVIDQEVARVTPQMWTWWFSGNLERYYRLWLPANHFSAKMTVPEGSGGVPLVQIEEMIGPYYTQFDCHIIPGGIGSGARGLEFLTPEGKTYGRLTHDVTPTENGIKIHSVFTFPAKTDQALLDATNEHCKIEMQDLPRFLPTLYNEKK